MRALVLGVVASGSSAFAQPVAAPSDVVQSVLPNLLATSLGTTVDARFDYSDIDGLSASVLNMHVLVQHLFEQGFGGYVAAPVGFVEDSDELGEFTGAGFGNVEVGALFLARPTPRTDLLARGGISIDTAPEDDDLVMILSTTLPRLVDVHTSALQTTWGRAQGQVRHASNRLRLGAALGVDVPIAGDGADAESYIGIVNAIAAIGTQQEKLGLGASLTIVKPIVEDRAGFEENDETLAGINLGGDYLMNDNARFTFGIGFSLEGDGGNSFGIGMRFSD